ncbi:GntR family transcriptional regulator [Glutamicibacter sp. PS]|uniref:GntR family transcriptional regulator n=1 Tax=Glutamicibacter sp. PS TaxID=3075634 RepID=UPI00283FC580|nr:GntR family transcriptional regulator [Glutamicibacter sp. PS]MDR4533954.1 GntR family transcriptional regulator [Glutamicibacter sp. PS]
MTEILRNGTGLAQSSIIAAGVRDEILSGTRRPGERIGQQALAEQYGTSRLPVREALRMLESEGLVTVVSNAGARVSKLELDECVEIYRIREQLDPLLVSLAVPNYTDEDIARLTELERAVAMASNVEEFLSADRTFHVESYRAARSPILFETVERMWNTTQHYRRAYSHLVGDDGLGLNHLEHQLMLAAFRDRDASEARRLLYSHIRRTRRAFTRHPEIFQEA